MSFTLLDERKVRIAVISFSMIGIAILAIISFASEVEEVHIKDLSSRSGRIVEVRGTVVGAEHHESGVANILLHEDLHLLEVTIERSDREVRPNDVLSIRGEPFFNGGAVVLTANTDRTMDIKRGGGPAPFSAGVSGSICTLDGTVITVEKHGYGEWNISVEYPDQDGGRENTFALAMEVDEAPSPGDGVSLVGLKTSEHDMTCYGPDSVVITYRATPVSMELLGLISSEPGLVPRDPLDIDGYLRYTPKGRTLYIGEAPEGASISIKAVVLDPPIGLSRGDKVRLRNCSLEWDPSSMRYDLLPSGITLMEEHGPWTLSLSNLRFGIGDFEGCEVLLTGETFQTLEGTYLQDGNATLEVRGEVHPGDIRGIVMYDPLKNAFYLDAVVA